MRIGLRQQAEEAAPARSVAAVDPEVSHETEAVGATLFSTEELDRTMGLVLGGLPLGCLLVWALLPMPLIHRLAPVTAGALAVLLVLAYFTVLRRYPAFRRSLAPTLMLYTIAPAAILALLAVGGLFPGAGFAPGKGAPNPFLLGSASLILVAIQGGVFWEAYRKPSPGAEGPP